MMEMKRRKEDEQSMSDKDLVRGALAGDSRAGASLQALFLLRHVNLHQIYKKP